MKFHYVVIAVFGIALGSPAQADDGSARLRAEMTVGTAASGAEIDYPIAPGIGVRAEATLFPRNPGISSDTMGDFGKVKLQSGSALADVFPFKSGFHISGGVRFFSSKVSAVAKPLAGATYTINGKIYSASQVGMLAANTNLTSIAPIVTIGYAARFSKRLVFGIEAGALLRGGIKANPLAITGPCTSATPSAFCGTIMADLEAERQGLNRDMSRSKVYPLVQLKLRYRF